MASPCFNVLDVSGLLFREICICSQLCTTGGPQIVDEVGLVLPRVPSWCRMTREGTKKKSLVHGPSVGVTQPVGKYFFLRHYCRHLSLQMTASTRADKEPRGTPFPPTLCFCNPTRVYPSIIIFFCSTTSILLGICSQCFYFFRIYIYDLQPITRRANCTLGFSCDGGLVNSP